MRLLRTVLALTAAIATTLAIVAAAPAQALSCIGPGSVADGATTIFTGKIVDSENKRMLVEIHEIWKGAPIRSPIWLNTDPTLDGWWDALPGHTVPDNYVSKGLWLFMPSVHSGEPQVSTCRAWPMTGPWKVNYPRPATVTAPIAADVAPSPLAAIPEPISNRTDDSTQSWLIGGAVAVAVIAAGAGFLVVRRLRTQLS